MPSAEQANPFVRLVEDALRQGAKPRFTAGPGRSAVELGAEKAIELGLVKTRRSFVRRLERAEKSGLVPDWDLWKPARYHMHPPRAQVFNPAPHVASDLEPGGDIDEVLVIPDLHQCPRHPHRADVLTWCARLGSERKIKKVVQLGDWLSMDSCSRHDRNETVKGRTKPSIEQDLESLADSLAAWERGRDPTWKPRKVVTLGNHEDRLRCFENEHPEINGSFTDRMEEMWLQHGWTTKPFGEIHYINGVGFTHAPLIHGRAMTGKNAASSIANESACSLIHGHTHKFNVVRRPKIGPLDHVTIIEAGCALPYGEIEAYARNDSMTGWWWGVTVVRIQAGAILDWDCISMKTMRERYA